MDNTLEIIKDLVKRDGVLSVAQMLEHSDTQNIKRWIKNDKIPSGQIAGIRAILSIKGEL